MIRPLAFLILAFVLTLLYGCASITQGLEQSTKIDTVDGGGQKIDGASCQLQNDKATAIAVSGQSALIRRSGSDLTVSCSLPGHPSATGRAISRANAGLAGNILIGGGIGAVIDASSGAAYTYPTWMQLTFGEDRLFDRNDHRDDQRHTGTLVRTATARAEPPSTPSTPSEAPSAAMPAVPAATRPPLRNGDVLTYRLTDQMTGNTSVVTYRLDRITNDELSFNGDARVEKLDGSIVSIRSPVGGLFDSASPPGGWAPVNVRPGMAWQVATSGYAFKANAIGEETYPLGPENLRVVKIQYVGWKNNTVLFNGATQRTTPMNASVLWAPELKRVVRFEAEINAFGGTTRESLELQRIETE